MSRLLSHGMIKNLIFLTLVIHNLVLTFRSRESLFRITDIIRKMRISLENVTPQLCLIFSILYRMKHDIRIHRLLFFECFL